MPTGLSVPLSNTARGDGHRIAVERAAAQSLFQFTVRGIERCKPEIRKRHSAFGDAAPALRPVYFEYLFTAVVGDDVPEYRKAVSYRKIKTDGQGNEPRDLHKSAERDTGRRYGKCTYRNGEKTDYQIIGSPPVALRRIFHGITCFPANTAKDRIKAKDRKQLAVFSLKLLLFL